MRLGLGYRLHLVQHRSQLCAVSSTLLFLGALASCSLVFPLRGYREDEIGGDERSSGEEAGSETSAQDATDSGPACDPTTNLCDAVKLATGAGHTCVVRAQRHRRLLGIEQPPRRHHGPARRLVPRDVRASCRDCRASADGRHCVGHHARVCDRQRTGQGMVLGLELGWAARKRNGRQREYGSKADDVVKGLRHALARSSVRADEKPWIAQEVTRA